uniref:Uncharacterized protein n=1 Tax=Malurus cyaneus samueli TaxID=2593467 RepID=A0A8C5T3U2_9PASS
MSHHTDHLLPGSLAGRGEILAIVGTHPEVLRIHVQFVTVEFAQLSKTFLDAVQVLDGFPEGGQHLLAMSTDHGVASDGRGAGQVPKGGKEPLGPGVDNQHAALGHVDLAPEAGDESLLLGCPVHHGAGRGAVGVSLSNEDDVAPGAAPGIFIDGLA